jgi:hypothetical protein
VVVPHQQEFVLVPVQVEAALFFPPLKVEPATIARLLGVATPKLEPIPDEVQAP